MRSAWIMGMAAVMVMQSAPLAAQGNARPRIGQTASDCLEIERGNKAFLNRCNYDVHYQFCRRVPASDRINNCSNPGSTAFGYQRIAARGRDTQYMNGQLSWFACASPAVPKGVIFDGAVLRGRCEIS
jgi:hypothetical protein